MRQSLTGKQAYNAYLGVHGVGQGVNGRTAEFDINKAKKTNHVAPSNSSLIKKAIVPLVEKWCCGKLYPNAA